MKLSAMISSAVLFWLCLFLVFHGYAALAYILPASLVTFCLFVSFRAK